MEYYKKNKIKMVKVDFDKDLNNNPHPRCYLQHPKTTLIFNTLYSIFYNIKNISE